MTYRAGVWVFDRANSRVGKVLRDGEGPNRVVIMGASGIAWQAKALDLRLATPAEGVSVGESQVVE